MEKEILLINDDGIGSPGLQAAAAALAKLGHVTVAAPDSHFSHFGRGYHRQATGKISKRSMQVNGENWEVYGVDGAPAQTFLVALMEIVPKKPDLVVSGINYGENVSSDVTSSGTVGAALEAASFEIPALASSVQILQEEWDSYHVDVDFSSAAHFTWFFADLLLKKKMPFDVDVLNITVPVSATPQTPWRITRLARERYYDPYIKREGGWDSNADFSARRSILPTLGKDTDIHAAIIEKIVSVTPLSLDSTSRANFDQLDQLLRN